MNLTRFGGQHSSDARSHRASAAVAGARQPVDIEESVAGYATPRRRRLLYIPRPVHVEVAGVAGRQEQPMIQRDEHQHRTRLGVGRDVREHVRLAKSFVAGCPTPPVTYIFAEDRVGPHAAAGGEVVFDSREHTNISKRHHQRDAVHGVANRLALFQHRLVDWLCRLRFADVSNPRMSR